MVDMPFEEVSTSAVIAAAARSRGGAAIGSAAAASSGSCATANERATAELGHRAGPTVTSAKSLGRIQRAIAARTVCGVARSWAAAIDAVLVEGSGRPVVL